MWVSGSHMIPWLVIPIWMDQDGLWRDKRTQMRETQIQCTVNEILLYMIYILKFLKLVYNILVDLMMKFLLSYIDNYRSWTHHLLAVCI